MPFHFCFFFLNVLFFNARLIFFAYLAMGLPAEGIEGMYRNDIDKVASFLDEMHHGKYLVVNLSQKLYDINKFHGNVVDFGFPDHHAPDLHLMFLVSNAIHQYLQADPENVVAVHCKVCQRILVANYYILLLHPGWQGKNWSCYICISPLQCPANWYFTSVGFLRFKAFAFSERRCCNAVAT